MRNPVVALLALRRLIDLFCVIADRRARDTRWATEHQRGDRPGRPVSPATPTLATHSGISGTVRRWSANEPRAVRSDPTPEIGSAMLDARQSAARILRPCVRKTFLELGHAAGGLGRGGEPPSRSTGARRSGSLPPSWRAWETTAIAPSTAALTVGRAPGNCIIRKRRLTAFLMR